MAVGAMDAALTLVIVCAVVLGLAWVLVAAFRDVAAQSDEAIRTQAEAQARAVKAAQEKAEARARAEAEAVRVAKLKAMSDAYRAWEYVCKAHALTCTRCGKLAYPIPLTANRYACPACGNQFVGAPHPVPLPPPNPDIL